MAAKTETKKTKKKAPAKKKTTKKEKKQEKKKIDISSKLINGIVLAIILVAFTLLAILLGGKMLDPTNLAKILPAEQTVGFITVDTSDLSVKMDWPAEYAFAPENLKEQASTYLNQESFEILESWFGGQVAVAYLMGPNQQLEQVYFVEYSNRAFATEFLESISAPEEEIERERYQGITVYSYPLSQNFSAAFIANYVVISSRKANVQLLIDSFKGESSSLKTNGSYNAIADNLPYQPTFLTYWNIEQYPEVIEKYVPLYEVVPESLIAPFMSIFTGFGAAGELTEDGLLVQTYTTVQKELLDDEYYFSFMDKYQANLTKYVPENQTIFWGGHDLYAESQRVISIFNQLHPSAALIFEGMLQAVATEYFGKNIELDEDIYPLLTEEYAIAVYGDEYLGVIQLGDAEAKQIHIDTLKQGFLEQQIYSDPYVQTYELEDGSTGQEIVADLVEILHQEVDYEGVEIDKFYLSNEEVLGYMTVFDGNFVFSTDSEILKKAVDLMKSPNGSLSASSDMDAINAIMRSADEASYIDLEEVRESEIWGLEALSIFSGFSSTKNFFDDGVATFHLFEFGLVGS